MMPTKTRVAPEARALWLRQLRVNAAAFVGFPTNSCSVDGHPVAGLFGGFLQPHLRGRALDIGCGPQPKAAYLGDYPDDLLAGIDPLPPFAEPHPFEFSQGVGEALPWPDGSFDTVILATTLDHVYDPAAVLAEARRVLRFGGCVVIWDTFWPGAPAYDPANPPTEPPDAYHVFHLSRDSFERLVADTGFSVVATAEHQHPYHSAFYILEAQ